MPTKGLEHGSGLLLASHLALAADKCALTIEANDQIKFNQTEMKVPAGCAQVQVTLKHVGKMTAQVMGHDWVLAKTADAQAVASCGPSVPAEGGQERGGGNQ